MQTNSGSAEFREADAYALSSELARACLPQATRDEDRKFVWTAAIAALFLVVGIHGLFTRPVLIVPPISAVDEIVPVLYEPPAPQPANTEPPPETATSNPIDSDAPPPAPVVVAIVNPAEATFAVPVEGPVVLAPARMASAPPIDLRAQSPAPRPVPQIKFFTGDSSGNYPPPSYPPEALQHQLQGRLLLLVVVGPNGKVSRVELKESSGSSLLDRHAAGWVQSHWVWPPGENRLFHVPVIFELK